MAMRIISSSRGVKTNSTTVTRSPLTKSSQKRFNSTTANTLASVVDAQTQQFEHHDFLRLVHQSTRWTYKEFKNAVDALANGFADQQYKAGHSTIVSSQPNDLENFVTQAATARAGIKLVQIPAQTSPEEVAKILDKITPRGFIFSPRTHDLEALKNLTEIEYWNNDTPFVSPRFPYLKNMFQTDITPVPGLATFASIILWNKRPNLIPRIVSEIKPIDVAYSYLGNNLEIKNYSQGEVLNAANTVGKQLGLNSNARLCNVLPMSSYSSVLLGLWGAFVNGSVVVVPSFQFDAEETLKALHNEHCTVIVGTAEQLDAIAAHPNRSKYNLSKLTKAVIVYHGATAPSTKAQQGLGVKEVAFFNGNTGALSK